MTKEEILAMGAGDELDNLVRAIIIGLPYHQWAGKPSTDISAAWSVVEKMLDLGFCIELYAPKPLATEWSALYVTNVSRHQTDKVYAPTAPEVICKAALISKLQRSEAER